MILYTSAKHGSMDICTPSSLIPSKMLSTSVRTGRWVRMRQNTECVVLTTAPTRSRLHVVIMLSNSLHFCSRRFFDFFPAQASNLTSSALLRPISPFKVTQFALSTTISAVWGVPSPFLLRCRYHCLCCAPQDPTPR